MNDRYDSAMQAVLDGVATPAEARDVEARVAADPAARERFEELRAAFEALRSVPKAFPPEGLVASVLAALPPESRPPHEDEQLFDTPRVIGASSRNRRGGRSRRGNGFIRVLQPWVFPRGRAMNERNNGMSGNRKIMIGGGLAIAAAAVAVSLGVFPPNSSETAGTIVPAQRYRAPQPTAADVQGQAGAGGQSSPTVAGGASVDRGGASAGDRGGLSAGDRGGLSAGDRGGTSAGDRGGMSAGDRGGASAGDRFAVDQGGTAAGDRGGAAAGDRGGTSAGDRGGRMNGDRGAGRPTN